MEWNAISARDSYRRCPSRSRKLRSHVVEFAQRRVESWRSGCFWCWLDISRKIGHWKSSEYWWRLRRVVNCMNWESFSFFHPSILLEVTTFIFSYTPCLFLSCGLYALMGLFLRPFSSIASDKVSRYVTFWFNCLEYQASIIPSHNELYAWFIPVWQTIWSTKYSL